MVANIEKRHLTLLKMLVELKDYEFFTLENPSMSNIKAYRELRAKCNLIHEGHISGNFQSITFRLIASSKVKEKVKKLLKK